MTKSSCEIIPCNLFSSHLSHDLLGRTQGIFRTQTREQIQSARNQPRPTCLVAGAQASPIVAVEVLVVKDVIPPVRIFLELFGTSVNRTLALRIAQEDA